jgi:hypothetical protein
MCIDRFLRHEQENWRLRTQQSGQFKNQMTKRSTSFNQTIEQVSHQWRTTGALKVFPQDGVAASWIH